MQAVIDDLLTTYNLSGKGKLVLLLHGWGDSAKGLIELQTVLSRKYQVLSVDLPGFGATQAPKETWDLDNYSDYLKHLLDKLELPAPHAVVGHSNGGALAIRALSLGSIKSEKLVLMAASGIRDQQHLKRFALKIIAKTGNLATLWMPERYRRALRKSLYGVAGSDEDVAPHLKQTFRKTVRQDVQADATKLDLPTLLIYASNDRAVPLADGQKYNRLIKDSRLEIIDDAGHFVHIDQSKQVNNLVEDFLK